MWIDVIAADALQEGECHVIVHANNPIAVFKHVDNFYAIEDRCSHENLPLSEGFIEKDNIVCPFHGAKFCLKTGKATAPPAFVDIKSYETRVVDNMIQVLVW